MAYVIFALVLFSASVTTHILFCRRTSRQGLQARAFIFIAVFFISIYTIGIYCEWQTKIFDPHSFWGMPFQMTAGLVFLLLVPVYLSFYVLTQLMSPSKKILLAVTQRVGITYGDIVRSVQEEDFINTRLNDLCSSGCVAKVEDRYRLSTSGKKIASVLNTMQQVLGRDIGG